MRILQITPSFYPAFTYGGPTILSYELCRKLPTLGCEVRVLTTDANGLGRTLQVDTAKDVQFDAGFSVRYCHRMLRHAVAPALIQLLPGYIDWADVVHLHYVYSFPTLPTHVQCRLLRKPLLWSAHGAMSRWANSSRRTAKAFWDFLWYHGTAKNRLLVHFASEQEEKDARARFPKLHTAVVPNGVDVPVELDRTQSRAGLRMLFLGRLHPIKGLENLLEACSLLGGQHFGDWHLAVAGSGKPSYVAGIRQQIASLEMVDRVEMLGEVTGPAKKRLFENSDLVIVPSYSENFGIVVAEALAHAVPVIASRGTPWSGLEQNGCGLWVENGAQHLAEAIREIAGMPLEEMGVRGRDWMQREFNWTLVGQKIVALYGSLA